MYKKRSSTSKHDPTVRFKTYTYGLRIIRVLCGVLNVNYIIAIDGHIDASGRGGLSALKGPLDAK